MKKLFALFIILPLLVSFDFPWVNWDFNWDWKIDFDWESLLDKFKSAIPDFMKQMKDKVQTFLKKTEEERNKFLKNLDTTISDLQEKIKNGIEQHTGNIQEQLQNLVEKATEAAKYVSVKVCNMADMTYEECRNDKKKLVTNLIKAVKDNFGECSVIVGQISKLTEKAEMNLKSILFLVESITENPDAIEQGKSQIVYDVLNCLQDKMAEYWPTISAQIGEKSLSFTAKKDVTNLLLKSFSNLVNIIHFEELDGYIEKASNLTGLISSDKAKKIHQGIFKVLKKLNEFGEGLYNISSNLTLNVITNPGNLDASADAEVKWFNDEEKGIRIQLHSNYMLREKGASSLQAVIFDSPLVSVRASNQKESGGTSNTFVGITLYDKDGNEIVVKDFNLEDLRPAIFFKKKLFNAMTTCLYYNEEEDKVENKGILSTIVKLTEFDGEEYIKCIPKHLSSFTIGSYESSSLKDPAEEEKNNTIKIIIIVASCVAAIALIIGIFCIYRCVRRKNNDINNKITKITS